MKFSIHALKETPVLNFTYDYTHHLRQVPDMLSIEPASIHCELQWIESNLIVEVHLDVNMELACAKTLKPVPYQMHMDTEIMFGSSEACDFPLTDPLELPDILFGYIVSEKPYTIYHPDAENTSFEQERSPHPAFADLDKTFKK